jgi:hypothetical protein
MAITLLPEKAGLGELFGTGLGRGLGSGLKNLAESKLKQMQQREQAGPVSRALGISEESALDLLSMPPALAQRKMEGVDREKMLSSLLNANVPENVANAIVSAPKSMQREMLKPLLRINKEADEPTFDTGRENGKQKKVNSIYSARKQLISGIKSGKIQEKDVREHLLSNGVTPEEIDVILGDKLNDNIVRYFLDKTNNNPKKARALAKKFGYKV